jgi:hypothetical protein
MAQTFAFSSSKVSAEDLLWICNKGFWGPVISLRISGII